MMRREGFRKETIVVNFKVLIFDRRAHTVGRLAEVRME
jgi:hypothetical protein